MPTSGFNNSETVAAWADIVLKIWKEKLTELQVYESGELHSSLLSTLLSSSGDNVSRIDFSFKLYGIFVDMGVGREIFVGNPGDVPTIRKRKIWYSRIFYREVMKLREILAEKYSNQVADQVVNALRPVGDLKYSHAKSNNPFLD